MASRFDKDVEVQFREFVIEEFKKLHDEIADLKKQLVSVKSGKEVVVKEQDVKSKKE